MSAVIAAKAKAIDLSEEPKLITIPSTEMDFTIAWITPASGWCNSTAVPSRGRALVSRNASVAETCLSAAGAGISEINRHIRRFLHGDAIAVARNDLVCNPMRYLA